MSRPSGFGLGVWEVGGDRVVKVGFRGLGLNSI